MISSQQKKTLAAWCLYDVAASAFPIIIITFVFATYFTSKMALNEIIGTYQWSHAMALASFIIAFISPIFGAIADHAGQHKRWLYFIHSTLYYQQQFTLVRISQ